MPLQVPQEYKDLYTNTTTNQNRVTLLGMITAMDDVVGNITAVLKHKGMFENTLIMFLSDNGAPVANSELEVATSTSTGWECGKLKALTTDSYLLEVASTSVASIDDR